MSECGHLKNHSGKLPMSLKWRDFRWWMKMNGWHEAGYCDWYFPRWLLRPYAVYRTQQRKIWTLLAMLNESAQEGESR